MKAVNSRDHVTAFEFFVRDVTFRVAGDSDDVSRVVQVDFLAGEETVDDKILRIHGDLPGHLGQTILQCSLSPCVRLGERLFSWDGRCACGYRLGLMRGYGGNVPGGYR